MDPVTRIENRTEKRISFLMELEGKVVYIGVCKIGCVESKKIVKVSQSKIFKYSDRHQNSWKIRVLVDGICSGLVVKPIDLINYPWIVFSTETLDDGSVVLKVKGLKTHERSSKFLLQLRWSFGLGSKRHREKRMHEEMYLFEDIGEARVIDEGMRSEMDYYSLEYQQPFQVANMKAARLSTEEVKQETKRWEHGIVCHVAADDMKDYVVEQFVNEEWKSFGSFEIHKLKPQFFLFIFANEDEKRKLLEHGQWLIGSRPLILKKWTPNLQLDPKCFLSTLPVWVKFPNLNLEFRSPDSIAKIASVIGTPLFTDQPTAMDKILEYARVCIEVNPLEELPNVVPIQCGVQSLTFDQRVEYEWTPQRCRHCESLLHDSLTCFCAPNVACSSNAYSCKQLLDEVKVLPQSFSPVPVGIHGAATRYDIENEVDDLTDEADAQTDINTCISTSSSNAIRQSCDIGNEINDSTDKTDAQTDINTCISTSGSNAIQESCDINSQETTNTELERITKLDDSEDAKNYSATARLLGSGKTASKKLFTYSKEKAISFVKTTNTWIAIVSES